MKRREESISLNKGHISDIFAGGYLHQGFGHVPMNHKKEITKKHKKLSWLLVKDQMIHIIHNQPDDSSYDEILKELAFHGMIEHGLADFKQGRTGFAFFKSKKPWYWKISSVQHPPFLKKLVMDKT